MLNQGVLAFIMAAGIPLFGAAIVGLVVTFFQAVFSLQEQTVTFVMKLLVVIAIVFVFGPRGVELMVELTELCLLEIADSSARRSYPRVSMNSSAT